jgi:hypothetical protein
MWVLENNTPFAAERTLACDRNGADLWLVAVKGTFLIAGDRSLELAQEQQEVLLAPVHRGDPAVTSLLYEADLDYTKPGTDIILHGHAHAPAGRVARQIDVAMRIGSMSKTLRVFGDRVWDKGVASPALSEPKPFQKMPITFERAFGGADLQSEDARARGWEPRNPVGQGFAAKGSHIIGRPAANVEDPGALISSWQDRPAPAGFGPIARHWSPRVALAGTYDEQWQKKRLPLLPEDFNERFFQCAPADQQSPVYLAGGEPVELINLSPAGPLRFNVPRVELEFTTRLGASTIEHGAKLHTVIFEPDVSRVILVWHTALPCHGKKFSLPWCRVEGMRVS